MAPFFYFGKTHFFSMFLKSTLPIFNVSRLGQSSDLFLLLFFSLTIVEILMSCSACCSYCTFVIFLSLQHFALWLWARFKKRVRGFCIILTFFLLSMVSLQFLVGHLVKLRWRLSTPHQLKWSGAHRCPPSSMVRSEGTRCTMSGWLMGSPQDSQSSRTSWLMMPRYNTLLSQPLHLSETSFFFIHGLQWYFNWIRKVLLSSVQKSNQTQK